MSVKHFILYNSRRSCESRGVMLTNLVAAVAFSLATNVTEVVTEWASHESIPCPDSNGISSCLFNHWKGVDPIAKQITSNIVEVATISFEWGGQKHEVKREKVLASTVTTVRKSVEWRASTNTPIESGWHSLIWTNATNIGVSDLNWQPAPLWNLDVPPSGDTHFQKP